VDEELLRKRTIELASEYSHYGYRRITDLLRIESIIGLMQDKLLSLKIYYSLKEVQMLIEMWRRNYNTIRPYCALEYRPPVPTSILIQFSQIQWAGLS
jgi:hypothetical protein